MRHWNLPGSLENWDVGIERRVWGLRPHFANTWERLSPGDVLFFYVKAPVGGLVGYGHVLTKFKDDAPLWPDEVKKAKVIYPLRFEFDVEKVLDPARWTQDRIPTRDLGVVVQSIGQVPSSKASTLLKRIQTQWGEPRTVAQQVVRETQTSRHDQAKELLLDIGRMKGFLSRDEYRMDGERLDVVWKRVEKSVPTYVFEVQVGGDIYHAIGKLKHAFDLWNSRIFLVVDERSLQKVSELLGGTFHEVASHLKILQLEKLEPLQRGTTLRVQLRFTVYLEARNNDPSYTLRKHLRQVGGAIEE